ncbi:UPF0481 protein At3g47200-like [Camellia sinensis]|uniref:Uncharacterized protein n=1 Tax=Camellia sinensis var. sinensis TaxID=542762 RepID=A0A4V3WNF1_CAMSN|nr:UPF0481 protein At3g47200-like [Camellia sinensis]THG12297.1 hypothetical protein TEA_001484 [Camellia sinensis var. sinensis]
MRFSMEEIFNNNSSSTKTSNREVKQEIMVIDGGEEPSKRKSESETMIEVEESLFTPRIPRVPPVMRNHENNKGMFDPKVVSIGPYHHGKEDLQLVENIKPKVAKLFLQDSGKDMAAVYSMILEMVVDERGVDDPRSYYDKCSTDKYSREQFANMMLLDGCFILAIIEDSFLFNANQGPKYDDFRNHLGIPLWFSTFGDIFYLLENQLPFQVLELLMSLKFKGDEGMKSIKKVLKFLISMDTGHLGNTEDVNVNQTDWELAHLLQLVQKNFLNLNRSLHVSKSQMGTRKGKDKFQCKCRLKDYIERCHKIFRFVKKHKYSKPKYNLKEHVRSFRSVTELKEKGIYFTPNSSLSRQDIEFKSCCFYGRLELHPVIVHGTTKLFFSNMLAYEMISSTRFEDLAITSYVDFMKLLIDNQADVKELRSKHVLFNAIGNDQDVANVFKEITIFGTNVKIYADVKQRIQDHYNSTAKTWMAACINKYFSGPWTAIAFVAATCLFVLAFLQTYYTISPCSSHK